MSAAAHVLKRNAGTATDQEDFVGRVRIHSSPNPKLTLQLCPRQPSGPVATAASVLATTVTTPAWPRMTSQCAQRPTPRPQARPPRRSPLSRSRAWTATCKVCDGHSLWGKVGQRRVAPRFCCSLYEAYTATVPRVVEKPALRVQTNRFTRLESIDTISKTYEDQTSLSLEHVCPGRCVPCQLLSNFEQGTFVWPLLCGA